MDGVEAGPSAAATASALQPSAVCPEEGSAAQQGGNAGTSHPSLPLASSAFKNLDPLVLDMCCAMQILAHGSFEAAVPRDRRLDADFRRAREEGHILGTYYCFLALEEPFPPGFLGACQLLRDGGELRADVVCSLYDLADDYGEDVRHELYAELFSKARASAESGTPLSTAEAMLRDKFIGTVREKVFFFVEDEKLSPASPSMSNAPNSDTAGPSSLAAAAQLPAE